LWRIGGGGRGRPTLSSTETGFPSRVSGNAVLSCTAQASPIRGRRARPGVGSWHSVPGTAGSRGWLPTAVVAVPGTGDGAWGMVPVATRRRAMEQRVLGRTGRSIGVVGLGTWQLGSDWGTVSEEDAMGVLESAV